MMYLAVATNAEHIDPDDLTARSQGWWNEGKCPPGLRTTAAFRTVGTGGPDVYVFEAQTHEDLHQLVAYWQGIVAFDIHPAFDALEQWRDQGMQIP